jgi:hypothetical protein
VLIVRRIPLETGRNRPDRAHDQVTVHAGRIDSMIMKDPRRYQEPPDLDDHAARVGTPSDAEAGCCTGTTSASTPHLSRQTFMITKDPVR